MAVEVAMEEQQLAAKIVKKVELVVEELKVMEVVKMLALVKKRLTMCT